MLLNPIPSYAMGWARNPGQAMYPDLWKGLVGYWDPTLGKTGEILYDWSPGPQSNGVLTNMVAADAWVVTERGDALDYDGNNQHVQLGDIAAVEGLPQMSVFAWCKITTQDGRSSSIVHKGSDSGSRWSLSPSQNTIGGDDDILAIMGNGENSSGHTTSGLLTINEYHHVGFVFDGRQSGNAARLKIYIDGNAPVVSFVGTIPATTPSNLIDLEFAHYMGIDYFPGQIGPVSIYNIALPESRIQLMAAGATPAMLAEPMIMKAPAVGLLLKQSNMDGGMMNLTGGFV